MTTIMNAEQRLNKILEDAKKRVYKQRELNPEKYREYQKNLMKERRLKNKEEEKKKNTEYKRKYRENQKKKVEAINTLSNAIKNRKARKELEEAKNTKTLLNNIVKDALFSATTATVKRGRPKGSKNVVVEKTYNLRSRGK